MGYFVPLVVCAFMVGQCMPGSIPTDRGDALPVLTDIAKSSHNDDGIDAQNAEGLVEPNLASPDEVPVPIGTVTDIKEDVEGVPVKVPAATISKTMSDVQQNSGPEEMVPVPVSKVILTSGTRMLVLERLPADILQDCTLYTDIEMFDIEASGIAAVNVTDQAISEMDKACQLFKARRHGLYRHKRGLDIIVPGTKWCGAGTAADDYHDLGERANVDKCCRAHDHCPISIGAFEKKYELRNAAVWTKSHCDCDSVFYDCLKAAGDSLVGLTYFNILDIGCIKEMPQYRCAQDGFLFGGCAKYEPDLSKPKVMEFQENHLVY